MSALTRWMFTRNLRLVMAVTCVPIPPDFFALPERQMMLPFIGRLPVNSQMRAIKFLSLKSRKEYQGIVRRQVLFKEILRAFDAWQKYLHSSFYGYIETVCRAAA